MPNRRKTREERLQEIWTAAKHVFLSKGYKNTTMEDIINETNLSKGGFYHYYSSTKEILIDIMRNKNVMFVEENKHIQQMTKAESKEQIIELFLESLLYKFLVTSEDKRLYMMFGYEIMYDEEIRQVFIQLEKDFFDMLMKKTSITFNYKNETLLFISRMVNSLLFGQNLFNEPKIFESKREELKAFFKPMIVELLQ